jgi:hypothetical protein
MMPPKKKGEKWLGSKSKELLFEDIMKGSAKASMKPKDEHLMRPEEYGKFPYKRFWSNLNNLGKAIIQLKQRATGDGAALIHDRQLHPIDRNNPG